MKTKKFSAIQNYVYLSILTMMICLCTSCAKKITFQNSPVVPAARGSIKITKDHNSNYGIKIELTNLAEVERLTPPKRTYVIWMVTGQEITKNIGKINSSSGTFSSKLKASFETVSSFKPRKIFITAEDDASIQYPGMQVVLSTDNF